MNETKTLDIAKASEQAIQSRGILRQWRIVLSFFLGVVSVVLMFFLGEVWGEPAMFAGLAVFFLVAQYLLSRGNHQAVHNDWLLILALNLPLLISSTICLLAEPNRGTRLTALGTTVLAIACSYAGDAVAARTAHSRKLAGVPHH